LIETLTRNWRLLAFGGVLNAIISVIYFIMRDTDGPLAFHSWNRTIAFLGKLALAAGICTIVAAVWRSSKGKCWLLVLNGLALAALGFVQYALTRFPISFLTIAILVVLMAMSLGLFELDVARTLRDQHRIAAGWFSDIAGVASVGLAVGFLALGFRWIRIEPGSHTDLLWLGSFFALSALCMLSLALGLRAQSRQTEAWRIVG
jgi:uncharacterized membrane protein HdeD (DUF308 family)